MQATIPFAATHPLPPNLGFCVVIPEFLTTDECAAYIALSESRGFASAESDYPPSYRNNERLVIDDPVLAAELFKRLRDFVPHTLNVDNPMAAASSASINSNHDNDWTLVGINERIRFCRYLPHQQFSIHQDGVFHRAANCRSRLTFMIYLTDGKQFEGGDTLFYERGPGASPPQVISRVRPHAGTLILFDHRVWHAGEEVTAGIKHIMRSDLLYQRDVRQEPAMLATAHRGYVWTLEPHGDVIASAGRDTAIRLWKQDGSLSRTLCGHSQSVLGLASFGTRLLASVSRDRSLKLWDTDSGICLRSVQAHSAAVLSVVATQNGFATTSADHSVKVWNKDLELQTTFTGHGGWVWSTARFSNGIFVTASEDGTARLWNESVATYVHERPLRTIAISSDEQHIVAGDVEGYLSIWRTNDTSAPKRQLKAHAAAVRRIRFFTPQLMATAGEDNFVRVWDFANGVLLHEYQHANFATDMALTSAGEYWSCAYDGAVVRHCIRELCVERSEAA